MSSDKWPILPYPVFLSKTIQQYITDISTQTNRKVVFGDFHLVHGTTTIHAHASALIIVDCPGIIIFLDKTKINPINYDSVQHDSLIAHEITHATLLEKGWDRILPNGNYPQEIHEAIRTVENWLTDPVVNTSIKKHGYSLETLRNQDAMQYLQELEIIEMLKTNLLTLPYAKNVQTGKQEPITLTEIQDVDSAYHIRYFVTLCLEPFLSVPMIQTLEDKFKRTLPQEYLIASSFLKIINSSGYSTPQQYIETAKLCLEKWGVSQDIYRFEKFQKVLAKTGDQWLATETFEHGNWD